MSIKKRENLPVRPSYIRVQYTSDLLPRIISIESLFLDGFQTLNWKVCCCCYSCIYVCAGLGKERTNEGTNEMVA